MPIGGARAASNEEIANTLFGNLESGLDEILHCSI